MAALKQRKPMNRGGGFKSRGTGFASRPRPAQASNEDRYAERAKRAVANASGARAVSMGASTMTAQPKPLVLRNPRLLRLSRDQTCLLCVPGVCNHRTDTTVAAHSNWGIHSKGGGRKAQDCYVVDACHACHVLWLDQGSAATNEEKQAIWLAGYERQKERWAARIADPATKPLDREAMQWALGHGAVATP